MDKVGRYTAEASPQGNPNAVSTAIDEPQPFLVDLAALLADLNDRLVAAGSVTLPDSQPHATTPVEVMKIIIFRLGGVYYAIDIRYIGEIVRRSDVTHVPGLPGWVLGVINLHGDIVSVVDLALLLNLSIPATRHPLDTMVVAQAADQKIALMVDGVELIYTFPTDQVLSLPLRDEPELVQYLRGAVEREGHLIRLLDGERLLLGPQMQQFS